MHKIFIPIFAAFLLFSSLAIAKVADIEGSFLSILETIGQIADKVWNYKIVTMDKQPITISNLVIGIILFIIGLKIIRKISRLIRYKMLTVMQMETGMRDAMEKISYYILLVIMILLVLDISNVPIKIFTFIGGALAIGIGFGSQNIISNFISGLILMVERPIRVGDLVEVDNTLGRVVNIGARCTHLRTGNSIDILVPNSSMLEGKVVNWTHSDSKVRIHISLGVSYGSPPARVEALLLEAAHANAHILSDPLPQVFFTSFGENSLQFEIHFWINIAAEVERKRIISDLNNAIEKLFRENHITFPFPQRDVHVDIVAPIEVRMVEGKATTSP